MFGFIDHESKDCSLVPLHAYFKSDMQTNGDLDVVGKLIGKVDVGRLLKVSGYVEGSITTFDFLVTEKGSIKGNVKVDNIMVCAGFVEGDVEADNIEVYGQINGNVKAKENVIVHSGGCINGDVSSRDFYIDSGGKINGNAKKMYIYTIY